MLKKLCEVNHNVKNSRLSWSKNRPMLDDFDFKVIQVTQSKLRNLPFATSEFSLATNDLC